MSLLHLPYSDPSIENGYAAGPEESQYPETWRGMVGAWVPELGVQGSRLYDLSGYGSHGTLTNMDPATDWVATERGYALDFDGIDDLVNLGIAKGVGDLTNNFSISAWVKFGSFDDDGAHIVSTARTVTNNGFGFSILLNGNLRFTTFAILDYDATTISLSSDIWYHVAAVMDASNDVTFYVDGKSRQIVTGTNPANQNTTDPIYIGAGTLGLSATLNFEFRGLINGVRIYNRALTPEEIAFDYAVPLAPFRLRPRRVWVAGTPTIEQTTFRFRQDDGSLIAPEA